MLCCVPPWPNENPKHKKYFEVFSSGNCNDQAFVLCCVPPWPTKLGPAPHTREVTAMHTKQFSPHTRQGGWDTGKIIQITKCANCVFHTQAIAFLTLSSAPKMPHILPLCNSFLARLDISYKRYILVDKAFRVGIRVVFMDLAIW